jgi:hypothetical protein
MFITAHLELLLFLILTSKTYSFNFIHKFYWKPFYPLNSREDYKQQYQAKTFIRQSLYDFLFTS